MQSPIKWLKNLNRQRVIRRRDAKLSAAIKSIKADYYILSPEHTLYIAKEIENAIKILTGKKCFIMTTAPGNGYQSGHYFVICPQVFEKLPEDYTAFQLEQSRSSSWFTPEYLVKLKNARYVLDYSDENVAFLAQNGLDKSKLFLTPLAYTLAPKPVQPRTFKHEVAFYGNIESPRRERFLAALQQEFNTVIIRNDSGESLMNRLKQAKVIVNIHYYENALLETTRIYECLSENMMMISEKARDQELHPSLSDIVEFTEIDDIDEMILKVRTLISDDASLQARITENQEKLRMRPNAFMDHFRVFAQESDVFKFP